MILVPVRKDAKNGGGRLLRVEGFLEELKKVLGESFKKSVCHKSKISVKRGWEIIYCLFFLASSL